MGIVHVVLIVGVLTKIEAEAPVDWIERAPNGAYQFGYATGDEGGHYRSEAASADNTVAGKFGFRDPGSGANLETTYTSGRRGFRARGPHIARRMGLSQAGGPTRPNDDGQYHPELDHIFDPTEDRGYDFKFRTQDVVKEEHADARGDVRGRYTYIDDVGTRHTVDYSAGANTGFVVHNPVPDTFAQAQNSPLIFHGKGPGSKSRGYTAIQKNLDGSYRFSASGPDHKRTEISDAGNNRRGSYTYLDDKGKQQTVEYIAGPNIGYQVINNKRPLLFGPNGTPISPISPSLSPLFPDIPSPSSSPFGPIPTPSPFDPLPSPSPFDPLPSPSPIYPGSTPSTPTSTSSSWGSSSTSTTSSPWVGSSTPSWTSSSWASPDLNWPSSTPSWFDPYPEDFNSLHHQLFPESIHTAETSGYRPKLNNTGTKPSESGGKDQPSSGGSSPNEFLSGTSSCCNRSWKNGPKSGSTDRGSVKFRLFGYDDTGTKKVAVRAHVQNIDILPNDGRYMSPSEALELFGSGEVEHRSRGRRSEKNT